MMSKKKCQYLEKVMSTLIEMSNLCPLCKKEIYSRPDSLRITLDTIKQLTEKMRKATDKLYNLTNDGNNLQDLNHQQVKDINSRLGKISDDINVLDEAFNYNQNPFYTTYNYPIFQFMPTPIPVQTQNQQQNVRPNPFLMNPFVMTPPERPVQQPYTFRAPNIRPVRDPMNIPQQPPTSPINIFDSLLSIASGLLPNNYSDINFAEQLQQIQENRRRQTQNNNNTSDQHNPTSSTF